MSKIKSPYKPTEFELEGAPRAFTYEIEMFRFSIQILNLYRNQYSVLFDKCIHNVFLEAALLHARNLLEFFTRNQPKKGNKDEDSICASYFVGKSHKNNITWWTSSKLPLTQSRKSDINKSLSHLTFKRIGQNFRWDDLPNIQEEIENAYSEFIQLLSIEEQGKWDLSKNY